MFAGHLGVALGAKVVEPKAPLGALVAASFGIDLLWPILLLAGAESVSIEPGATAFTPLSFDAYPWSHSLAMVLLWGVLAWGLARVLGRSNRVAVVIGGVLVSHWVLDFVTHRPDLALWPGGPLVGLGLWNSIPGTFLLEGLIFAGAVALYARRFPPRDGLGRAGIAALVGLVVVIWAWRIERHRMPAPS